jgi:nucleoside-diphosphate-sugar epimerase
LIARGVNIELQLPRRPIRLPGGNAKIVGVPVDFRDRHVIVTGGTGALGTAVVGALLKAGAFCHVPYVSEPEAQSFAHRANPRARLVATASLSDEAVVAKLFDAAPNLWASIHLVGGYAWSPVSETAKLRSCSRST